MKIISSGIRIVLLGAACAWLTGCANVSTKPSGFLGNCDDLSCPRPGKLPLAAVPRAGRARFDSVLVEPVTFQTNAAVRLSERKRIWLAEDLTRRARKVFGTRYAIGAEPGPGVLRLRMTVNDLKQARPLINVLTTAALYLPLDMGAVSVEMEAVDSQTGKRIAALVDKRQGWPVTPRGLFRQLRAHAPCSSWL